MRILNLYKIIKQRYQTGILFLNNSNYIDILNNSYHIDIKSKSTEEIKKKPTRTDIINYLLSTFNKLETNYLEIGVRNPDDNFNKIKSKAKFSVDPGVEFKENPVSFKMTSDTFFEKLKNNEILNSTIKFDVIFIDGLHLADQVERDIKNSFDYIADNGFIVVHDCNPPSEFHAREAYNYWLSPAEGYWNGTTWKAFVKIRQQKDIFSCCINSDWGVGIISKTRVLGKSSTTINNFFEYYIFNENREECLNLIEFEDFRKLIN